MPPKNDASHWPLYTRYWGKATPQTEGARYHLLAFHSLDVAACGQLLLELPQFGLQRMSALLGWHPNDLKQIFVALLALHDLGKFARSFQGLAPDLGKPLVPAIAKFPYTERHDTLGWLLLNHCFLEQDDLPKIRKAQGKQAFWQDLFRVVTGHHGKPPRQTNGGFSLRLETFFNAEDTDAARQYIEAALDLLLNLELPVVQEPQRKAMQQLSWQLAGIAVLADWLGSNATYFPYHEKPLPLDEYWVRHAQPGAQRAVAAADLGTQAVAPWSSPQTLFPFSTLTPLQQYAETVPLAAGPQLFLLEDVTGAGKTEAALLLCHRLMAAGLASGLYFGLPTMATANQLHGRVGIVYRNLYQGGTPSLVLSHGARDLVDGFRDSILAPQEPPRERDYTQRTNAARGTAEEDCSATAYCSAWLADSRKKAMLADVGVGTVDQALLGILPVRHQSLRLLGLSRKVLVIDEVHAYDAYTSALLQALVQVHTMAGGSTVLLSATVPLTLRAELVRAFQNGLPEVDTEAPFAPAPEKIPNDLRYPLATHARADGTVQRHACATRPDLVRDVEVTFLHSFEESMELVAGQAKAGRAVCWIRNTVEDARDAFRALQTQIPPERLTLFHARFAMGDRLKIEQEVLGHFGKDSTPEARFGQVLVATQVVEQSLDLDFDHLLSDLAPIDLLIQRAGRLHRHLRSAQGLRSFTGTLPEDGRGAPVLHLFTPPPDAAPDIDWYRRLFPRANAVYENTGMLWLTLKALQRTRRIASPGEPGDPAGVRSLLEAVYGVHEGLPRALERASGKADGEAKAKRWQGRLNSLNLGASYSEHSHEAWYSKAETPTRLGDESQTVYLVREQAGSLVPFVLDPRFAWEMSAVSLRLGLLGELSPAWAARFGPAIEALRREVRLLADPMEPILPLTQAAGVWTASCVRKGKAQEVRYSRDLGLEIEEPPERKDPA